MVLLYLSIVLCAINYVESQSYDLTRKEESKGIDVVQAVVDLIHDRCIFPHDRFFLRRLALVQSNDGNDIKTYRNGFDGGIWQIREVQYNETQDCLGNLSVVCSEIQNNFNIDWRQTTWKDLRKPLFSGLAAVLYIKYQHNNEIPSDLDRQAELWQELFASDQNLNQYTAIGEHKNSCDQDLDLAFVIDSSGSISDSDFQKTIEFLVRVVDGLPIADNKTRIGVVQFNSQPKYEFGLNSYHDKSQLISAIRGIVRGTGGTNTAEALRKAYQWLFSTAVGMRTLSSKVLVLVTDGASNSLSNTKAAAKEVKAKGIQLFAIGVGGANLIELNAVATPPICTHVFVLQTFLQMDIILNEIQRRACRSHFELTTKNQDKVPISDLESTGVTFQNDTKVMELVVNPDVNNPTNTTTLVTDATCSLVYIYASFLTTHPGVAFNEYSDFAVDGKPSILSILDDKGRPLYVTYQGRILNENSNCYNASFKIATVSGKPSGADVVCRTGGIERECSRVDFQLSEYDKYLCDDNWQYLRNPCTPYSDISETSNLFHPVESDRKKFIRCDYMGNMYVTQCPDGEEFDLESKSCGSISLIQVETTTPPPTSTSTTTSTTTSNLTYDPYDLCKNDVNINSPDLFAFILVYLNLILVTLLNIP